MSKKELRAEVNAALIQAAATLAAREHEVSISNFVENELMKVNSSRASIYKSDEYRRLTSREALMEIFADMLDSLKMRALHGHFEI